jgi:hypothetical protein
MTLKKNKDTKYKFVIKKPKIINIINKDYDYITAFIIYSNKTEIENTNRLYSKEKLDLLDTKNLQTIAKINKLKIEGTNIEIINRILNKFSNNAKMKLFSLNLFLDNNGIPYVLKNIDETEINSMFDTKINKINLFYNRNKIKVYIIQTNKTNIINFNNFSLKIQIKYFLYNLHMDETILNQIITNSFNKHLQTKIKNKFLSIKYKTILNYLFQSFQ